MICSCSKDDEKKPDNKEHNETPKEMCFEHDSYTIYLKQQLTLKVLNVPEEKIKDIKFRTSSPTCADINEKGVVTAYSEGDAVITATLEGKEAKCKIKVEAPTYYNLSFSFNKLVLNVGEDANIKLLSNEKEYNGKDPVVWESSDETVMTVDNKGHVTAKAFGAAVVEARIENGNDDNIAFAYVIVNDNAQLASFDNNYIISPFPYLKFPATRDEVIAAERNIKSDDIPLRKLIHEENENGKTILAYHLRNFFGHNPAATMFGNVFYNINANTNAGEPFCTAFAWGITNPDQVEVFGTYFLEKMGYSKLRKIQIGESNDIQMDAWRAVNIKEKKSVIIYIKPNSEMEGAPMGVVEWRLTDGDPYKFDD